MSSSGYEQAFEGIWYSHPKRDNKWACCDCGLVHTVNFRVRGNRIEVQMIRDGRATGGARTAKRFRA